MLDKVVQIILAVTVIGLSIGMIVTAVRLKNIKKTGNEIMCGEFGTYIDSLTSKCKANLESVEDCPPVSGGSQDYCGNHQRFDDASGRCILLGSVCGDNTVLAGGRCQIKPSVCGAGQTFDDTTKKCTDCQTSSCPDQSDTCGPNTTLQDGKCVPVSAVCGTGQTFNESTKKCSNCQTCPAPNSFCGQGTRFDSSVNKCVSTTPSGTGGATECTTSCCGPRTTFSPELKKCISNDVVPECPDGGERDASGVCIPASGTGNDDDDANGVGGGGGDGGEDKKKPSGGVLGAAIFLFILNLILLAVLYRRKAPKGPVQSVNPQTGSDQSAFTRFRTNLPSLPTFSTFKLKRPFTRAQTSPAEVEVEADVE